MFAVLVTRNDFEQSILGLVARFGAVAKSYVAVQQTGQAVTTPLVR